MQQDKVTQLLLPLAPEIIDVHCFFRCKYVARSSDPQQAHDLMEKHYAEKHSHQIEQAIRRVS